MLQPDNPPSPPAAALVRQRLLDTLERRFDVKVTLVLGGGGVGKTTLLAQAFTDQADRGDLWLSAAEADDPERLMARLLLGLGRDEAPTPEAIAEALMTRAPRHVCLMIDDAHRLPDPSVLSAIIEVLPRNGHVLIGSRRRPGIDLARLGAAGDVMEVGQSDLVFTEAEVREVATARRVDISVLEGAAGWPAFVELATRGEGVQSRQYLQEEAIARLGDAEARAIAAFAFVGGGDDALARAVTGRSLDELLHGLPLVIGDPRRDARPHDLWLELLDDRLDTDQRREAAERAAGVHAERGDYDTAIALIARGGSPDHYLRHVREACMSILDGGLRPDRLDRWVALMPIEVASTGEAHLLRGLAEREADPYADACWDELQSAAQAFREAGDADGEIAALSQLGYLTQWRDDMEALITLMARMGELAEQGVAAAQPFVAFGEAWLHFASADPAAQLRVVSTIDDASVPAAWRLIKRYLQANALLALGRPDEALAVVPPELRSGAAPLPGALTLEDQIEWSCGRPEVAVSRGAAGGSPQHGSRDRFMAGIWAAQMYAYVGLRDACARALEQARDAAGPDAGPVIDLQLFALSGLPALAAGHEDQAADALAQMFSLVPLETPMVKGFMRRHLAIPYVLLPDTREFWDTTPLGESWLVARAAAQALVAFRDEADLAPIRLFAWPEPGVLAAVLPLPWLIEFALIGGLAGVPAAQGVAAWAAENWGPPTREALRRHADGDDDVAGVAAQWLVDVPLPPTNDVTVAVVGSMRLDHDGAVTSHPAWRRERVRALLLYLLLHGPAPRDTVAYALWPDLEPAKADKNLRTTLNYLHQVLEPMRGPREASWFVRNEHGMLSVHPSLGADLRVVDALLDEAAELDRAGSSIAALDIYLEALPLWRGDLASGEADHPWADLERTRLRSRLVRAGARAGDLLVAQRRFDEAIDVCHRAIDADRWFEPAYAALARAYLAVDDVSSARRTLAAARRALAEIEVPLSEELERIVAGGRSS